jgi:hypothetical protein
MSHRAFRSRDDDRAAQLISDFTTWTDSDPKIVRHRFDDDGVLRFLLSCGGPWQSGADLPPGLLQQYWCARATFPKIIDWPPTASTVDAVVPSAERGVNRVGYLVTQDVDGEPYRRIRRQGEVKTDGEYRALIDVLEGHIVLQ